MCASVLCPKHLVILVSFFSRHINFFQVIDPAVSSVSQLVCKGFLNLKLYWSCVCLLCIYMPSMRPEISVHKFGTALVSLLTHVLVILIWYSCLMMDTTFKLNNYAVNLREPEMTTNSIEKPVYVCITVYMRVGLCLSTTGASGWFWKWQCSLARTNLPKQLVMVFGMREVAIVIDPCGMYQKGVKESTT